MNTNRTTSILQRFAVVLAVTTASYGLPQAQARTQGHAHGHASQHAQAAQQQR